MNKLLFFTTLIIFSISMQAQEAFMKGDNLVGANRYRRWFSSLCNL